MTNPAAALYRDTSGIALERLATFASEAGDAEGTEGFPSTPARILAAHGRVAVLDQSAFAVDLFDFGSGRWISRFGREGAGPGEFRTPRELFSSGAGYAVRDVGKRALLSFDSLGVFLGSRSLPPMTLRVLLLPGGEMLVWNLGGDARLLPASTEYSAVSPDSGTRIFLDDESGSRPDRCASQVTTSGFTSGRCTIPQFEHFSSSGALVARHTIDRPARTRRPEELLQLEKAWKERMASDGIPESVANTTAAMLVKTMTIERPFPALLRTTPDESTVVLEQLEQELNPTSARLHVLSREGVYLAEISLPYRVIDLSAGPDNLLLMISEDSESGERTAASYRLSLPAAVIVAGAP